MLLQEFRFYGDWFRHGLVHSWSHWPGRSLCHRLCGYPAWSRECKSTSGSSGAEAGSRTVTGDGSSVGGSGEGLPLVRGANPHFLPEAPPLRVFGLGWGRRWWFFPLGPRAGGSDRGWFRCRPVLGHIVPVPVAYTAISCGSRDRKSSSGSSGADAGSRTVTGDSLVCGGLGGVGGRPRGLPLLLHTGAGRRPASLDQGSAVDGVYLCSSPSGQSESDGGLGLRLPSSPLQLCRSCLRGYPPWSCDPAPSPLERVRGSRTVTWDVQGGRWLRWSWVAFGA